MTDDPCDTDPTFYWLSQPPATVGPGTPVVELWGEEGSSKRFCRVSLNEWSQVLGDYDYRTIFVGEGEAPDA